MATEKDAAVTELSPENEIKKNIIKFAHSFAELFIISTLYSIVSSFWFSTEYFALLLIITQITVFIMWHVHPVLSFSLLKRQNVDLEKFWMQNVRDYTVHFLLIYGISFVWFTATIIYISVIKYMKNPDDLPLLYVLCALTLPELLVFVIYTAIKRRIRDRLESDDVIPEFQMSDVIKNTRLFLRKFLIKCLIPAFILHVFRLSELLQQIWAFSILAPGMMIFGFLYIVLRLFYPESISSEDDDDVSTGTTENEA